MWKKLEKILPLWTPPAALLLFLILLPISKKIFPDAEEGFFFMIFPAVTLVIIVALLGNAVMFLLNQAWQKWSKIESRIPQKIVEIVASLTILAIVILEILALVKIESFNHYVIPTQFINLTCLAAAVWWIKTSWQKRPTGPSKIKVASE